MTQTEQTTHRIGETIANDATDKRLVSQIYKQLMRLNIQKINSPIKKGQKT